MVTSARGYSLTKVIENLNPLLRGWMRYFRYTEVRPFFPFAAVGMHFFRNLLLGTAANILRCNSRP